jgi:pimeloyl-ACP methyl ester carboxylesterase
MSNAFLRIVAAILKKDVLSFYPLLLLTALLQALDIVVARLDLWPVLNFFLPTLLMLANGVVIFSVVQADPPVSLTDDWLCRPVPRGALILAKLSLLTFVLYVPRVLSTLFTDLLHDHTFAESWLEAFLIQGWIEMLYVPIVLMAAVCTANVIQGIGVMIGLFVLVFVIPTPLVSPPGPEDLAVGEALRPNGMWWTGMVPGKLIFVLATTLCLWAAYRRRSLPLARSALVGGVVLGVLAIVAPMILIPWQSTFALQSALHGTQHAATSSAYEASVRQTHACFPALRVADFTTDGDFNSARQRFGVHLWSDGQLQAAGNDAIAFVTQVRARGLPDDWRLQVAYVQARYYGSGARPLLTLRPSLFAVRSTNGLAGESLNGETITHTWLLPEAALRRLELITEPRLELDYSVAVLEPVSAQLVTDGIRRHLSGIGYCGATRDTLNNRIVVDCFSAGRQPALIAAELDGVPASRVDSYPIDFTPQPLRVFNGQRVELTIQSPGLVESNLVKVNAYYANIFTTLRAHSKGLLGDALSACPLPSAASVKGSQVSSWNDRSPHQSKSIAVEGGVQLEVLDWGGSGRPLALLHGLGATAHSFDELAPLLSKHYRVVGITRRGIGYSSRPDHGYSQARLTQDIVQVLDALGIDKAVFVGHSIAGDELTTLGVRHSKRVAGLIYLDAAYDRGSTASTHFRELNASLPDRPQPLPEELLSYSALLHYFDRVGAPPLPEGELIAMWNMGNRYLAGQITIDPRALQAINAGIKSPDYASVHVPALAIYATSDRPDALLKPWYDADDVGLRERLHELQTMTDAKRRHDIEKFRNGVQGARVLELPGASHWILLSHRDAVLQAILDFVATLPPQ